MVALLGTMSTIECHPEALTPSQRWRVDSGIWAMEQTGQCLESTPARHNVQSCACEPVMAVCPLLLGLRHHR